MHKDRKKWSKRQEYRGGQTNRLENGNKHTDNIANTALASSLLTDKRRANYHYILLFGLFSDLIGLLQLTKKHDVTELEPGDRERARPVRPEGGREEKEEVDMA